MDLRENKQELTHNPNEHIPVNEDTTDAEEMEVQTLVSDSNIQLTKDQISTIIGTVDTNTISKPTSSLNMRNGLGVNSKGTEVLATSSKSAVKKVHNKTLKLGFVRILRPLLPRKSKEKARILIRNIIKQVVSPMAVVMVRKIKKRRHVRKVKRIFSEKNNRRTKSLFTIHKRSINKVRNSESSLSDGFCSLCGHSGCDR
ncbi:uncharacterized protein LOC131852408 [Achroia grisella]|uniref:uncharacterized protein LOC131852408 n=1 Tax=Achroia grisella TaxID=688607 RepID=UPI0027D21A98|nr:uncharacterized protein LOC131852408 [Achroia grisella]